MLTFNLKKEWFEKIKSGEKTHEYRMMTDYWKKRVGNVLKRLTPREKREGVKCFFCLGYPKADDKERRLEGRIIQIAHFVEAKNTDLKCDGYCFDFEFELIKEEK